jgi:hypothetical protein
MKIAIEHTDDVLPVKGIPCRIWKGTTAAGTPCLLYVALVQVVTEHGPEFEQELRDVPRPATTEDARTVWGRHHGPQPQ